LCRIKADEEPVYYTIEDGGTTNKIYTISEAKDGHFWLGCNRGIVRVSKTMLDLNKKQTVNSPLATVFSESDGMISRRCVSYNQNGVIQLDNNRIWYSTKLGIAELNPEKINVNRIPPPVSIKGVFIDGASISLQKENITTFRNIKNIRFDFAVPVFVIPQRTKIRTQLEGFEKEWQDVGGVNRRSRFYENLPSGTYNFKVIAANNDGVWNKEGVSYRFILADYFFRALWFKATALVLGLLLLVLKVYAMKKYLQSRKLKKRYANSILDPEKVEIILRKLDILMTVKKVFRKDDLSMRSLARKVNTTGKYLSQVLNECLHASFNDYVNGFRIEEAKRMLQAPKKEEKRFGMLDIAFEAGFNSKGTFNRVFKNKTGLSPSEFKKNHRKEE
ncbi:MAG: helix-turn-helix domain-containing protein, partial [bacterium]|nr:helix-turn-helix domain-containing protein [bacterium]